MRSPSRDREPLGVIVVHTLGSEGVGAGEGGSVELVVRIVRGVSGVAPAGNPGVRRLPGSPVRPAGGERPRGRRTLIRTAGRASPGGSMLGQHVPSVVQPRREITVDGLFLNQPVLDVAVVRLESRHLRAKLLVLEREVAEAGLERPDRCVPREDRTRLAQPASRLVTASSTKGFGLWPVNMGRTLRSRNSSKERDQNAIRQRSSQPGSAQDQWDSEKPSVVRAA